MQEINRNTVLVAPKGGGYLDLVSEDGEILAQMFVPEGRSRALRWLDLCGPGQVLQVADGVVALEPSHRIYTQDFGAQAFASSANPSFRVTSAARQAREFERRLRHLEFVGSRARARQEAQDRAETSVEAAAQPEPVPAPVAPPEPVPASDAASAE